MSTRVKVPVGGYVEGYDAGLRDSKEKRDRAFPKLRRRPSVTKADWTRYRVGYDDGYFDGLVIRARSVEP